MNHIYLVALVVAICFAGVQSKHTLHVDNVFPNEGPTVLISGPLHTDNLITDYLNVGSLTINSVKGLNVSTDVGFTIHGSSIDAKNAKTIDIKTTGSNSSLSIVTAGTFDVLGHVTIGSNDKLTFSAAGEFELLATGALLLNAGGANIAGDYLQVRSEKGNIIGTAEEEFFASSPAFTVTASNNVVISSNDLLHLDAELSISFDASEALIFADSIDIEAIRNNILLQSYETHTITVSTLDVKARGDATIASGNGIISFTGMEDLLVNAADDMVLDAHDSFEIFSASLQVSSRDVYFLSDGESHFKTSDGIFEATSNIQLFDGDLLLVETTIGDISLTATNGNWRSTAADYTKFLSENFVTFNANQSISFISNQGIDIRAERSDIFVGKTATGFPDFEPIHFVADDYVRFKGAAVTVNVTSIDGFSGEYIKFESDSRSSTNIITAENDFITATNGTFYLGSSGINIFSDIDLILAARNNLTISASYTSSSNIILDASNTFTERSEDYESRTDLFTINAFDDLDFTSDADTTLRSLKAATFDSGTSLTIDIDNTININANRNSLYATGSLIYNSAAVTFASGFIELVGTNDLSISGTVSTSISLVNGQFDADDFLFQTVESANYNADRFVILNGNQLFQYDDISISGNVFFTSPPNKDIVIDSTTLSTTGPFGISSANVAIVATDATYSPFEFTVVTDVEYPLSVTAAEFTAYAHDTIFTNNDLGYFDNEFIFSATNSINIETVFSLLFANNLVTFELTSTASVSSGAGITIQTRESDFVATSQIDVLAETGPIAFSAFEIIKFYSFDDITLTSQTQNSINGPVVYLRTLGSLVENTNGGNYAAQIGELSFIGGDLLIPEMQSLTIHASGELNFYAEDEFLVSAAITGTFLGDLFEMHSEEIYFNAGSVNRVTAPGGIDLSSEEGGEISIQQNSGAVLNTIASSGATFLNSNDELLYEIGADFIVDAADISFDSYAQDAGQYYFSDNNIAIISDTGDVFVAVLDVAQNGATILVDAATSASYSTGGNGGIVIGVTGSTLDDHLGYHVGVLNRATDDISIFAAEDITFTDESSSSFLSKSGTFTHTGFTATFNSEEQSIVVDSDTNVQFFGLSLSYDIDDYSVWQATRDILFDQGTDLTINGGEEFDIIADRGEVSFEYNGSNQMTWTADSINSQGADQFNWETGATTVTANSVEYFGDAELTFTASSIESEVTNNAYITSSLNNDILYDGTGDLTIDPAGFASFTAVKNIEWLTTGDASYTAADINFLSKGSVDMIATSSLDYIGEDFVGTIYNYADFEVQDSINIGLTTPGIVTFNLGGNTLNYGAKIDTTYTSISSLPGDSDILIDSTIFQSHAEIDNLLDAANAISIESQGTNSVGEDIYFTSNGKIDISATSVASTAQSIHYDYNEDLTFSAAGLLTIQSSTFIHFDLDQDFRIDAATWRTTANAWSFTSENDAKFTSTAGNIALSTSKTMVYESDQDTLFKTTGSTTFRTDQSNSPITFYSQDSSSRFIVAANALTAVSVAKLDFIGKNGFFLDSETVTISAADTFKVDTKGDIIFDASEDLTITAGVSRSNIEIDSTGEIFQKASTFDTNAALGLSFIPDKDLSINVGLREDAIDPSISMFIEDDFDIDAIGDFNYYTVLSTTFSFDTYDWVINGADNENHFAAYFSSIDDTFILEANSDLIINARNLYFNAAEQIFFNVDSVSFTLSEDINFITTEYPTSIELSVNFELDVDANAIDFHAFGNEPSSGHITINGGAGIDDSSLAPVLPDDELYTLAFVTTASPISFKATHARFVSQVEEDLFIYQNQTSHHVIVHAAGSDEYLRGIEVVASDIQIRSGLDVTNRAENIIFKELWGNPNTVLQPTLNAFLTEYGRPSLVSIHDQTYTAFGENRNGNGIEITSSVPIFDIGFEVDNVVFNSGHSQQILGEKGFTVQSVYDADIISHSSIIMEAQGSGVDTNSIFISTGKDSTSEALPLFIGPDVRFYADGDIFLDSIDKIVAEVRDTIRIESAQDFIQSSGNGIDINAPNQDLTFRSGGVVQISAPRVYLSGHDININTPTFTIGGIGSNIYFGSTEIEGNNAGDPTLLFNVNSVTFDSRSVDITSDTALIMPSIDLGIGCQPGYLWFSEGSGPDYPTLHYCDQASNDRSFLLLPN